MNLRLTLYLSSKAKGLMAILMDMRTALGPNDADDGDEGRKQRGLAIAALVSIKQSKVGYIVPSQSGKGTYIVSLGGEPYCSCPDFESRQQPCKHIYAVEYVIQREEDADGSVTYTEKVTYTQQWHVYNEAQVHEGERFEQLLKALCDTIPQAPQQGRGRRRHLISDIVFALASRTYSMKSGRRYMSEMKEARADGTVEHAVSYNSAFDYLEKPEMTDLLKVLIARTAAPLKEVEVDFAADSTGFGTVTYERWYDVKWGKQRSRNRYIKTHIMTGVKTNVITAIEATVSESSDIRQLPYLVNETARQFTMQEVSADKGYSARKSLHAITAVGATPFIPFQAQATGLPNTSRKYDALWHYMHAFYNFNRAEFNAHYHKRSNVETTFSMIKAKFGASVRAKTPTAQVNEVLLKALCHNIVVLIQSMYELGIEPNFRAGAADAR
jgi:transposase